MLYSHTYIHTHSTKMTDCYQPNDLLIYKAALSDDWNSVSHIFDQHPEVTNMPITPGLETPLMIAVGTNRCHRFVQQLLERLTPDPFFDLAARNYEGNTALHYAAKVGNIIDATRLVNCDKKMPQLRNCNGDMPLMLAASLGRKDMLQYLLGVTLFEMFTDDDGNLITLIIQAGFIDVALILVELSPAMVLETERNSQSALLVLATKPEFFSSGSNLGFWDHLVYSLIHVNKSKLMPEKLTQDEKLSPALEVPEDEVGTYLREHALEKSVTTTRFWRVLHYLAPPIKNIYDIKVKHIQTRLLVKRICQIIIEKGDHDFTWKILRSAIAIAGRYGAYELIEECILAYPSIIWYEVEVTKLFHTAIKQRQEKVYNLIYQMTSHKAFMASYLDKEKENALHIVAKLAPPHRLNIITGAVLQMQRELQWFKEVETFVPPSYKEALNKKGKTPRMVFTNQHKGLLREGQQWMKDTASSCTVVAALIVTVAFAAAFTVLGGNKDDDGKPMFLNKGVFMLFIISDAIALFSSSTSLLMFLGILTSRYAEDDFLYALPRRMTIGLVFLFLSLASTLIAFSATLALVLQDKVAWIAAPLVIMTSIPVCLFGLLQFPLLKELVLSTYGPSIFCKQNDRMIY